MFSLVLMLLALLAGSLARYSGNDCAFSSSLTSIYHQLESAGFEVKNIDVLGVHYSATIYGWYKNWVSNKENVIAKYGDRWYRIWVFFLAYSTITSRFVAPPC